MHPDTGGQRAAAKAKPTKTASAAKPVKTASRAAGSTRSYSDFWQGASVDPALLGQALGQLPDTADEIRDVAKRLGAADSDIFLGRAASETQVKSLALSDYRIVYFATHGLVAGDVKGLAEPSLALTIPRNPSSHDDGLLTASEIAQLKLNADFVVLSACNTIAGEKPGAEALSGLARAFFYAGTRAPPRHALGGRLGRHHHHRDIDLRESECGCETRPGRGDAARHGRLSE